MFSKLACFCIVLTLALSVAMPLRAAPSYPWPMSGQGSGETLSESVPPPRGFKRVAAESGSFAAWLRSLPMKPKGASVMLFNGAEKLNQRAHEAVFDIDVGKRDLQQCADAIMRLRAEYLYSQNRLKDIAFNFTNGKRVAFTRRYKKRDYQSFRKYMTLIFAYAGTYSLERELKKVALADMEIGDIFIKGGFPGHAVLVADMAVNPQTGDKRFLLLQSYMPAQDIHILRNPADPSTPWYDIDIGDTLVTPEWVFNANQLKRFPTR